MKHKKFAFTLAETLITLTILGVVAAIAIPSLIRRAHDRESITRLKEAAAATDNALQQALAEHGPVDNWRETPFSGYNMEDGDFITELISKYFNYKEFCYRSYNNDPSEKCFCAGVKCKGTGIGKRMNSLEYKSLNGSDYSLQFQGGIILLKNGSVLSFDYKCAPAPRAACRNKQNSYIGLVRIDTNGIKGPNRLGYDYFEIPYGNLGLAITHSGNPGSGNYPNSDCYTPQSVGRSCGRYVLKYNNMDYKYKDISKIWK